MLRCVVAKQGGDFTSIGQALAAYPADVPLSLYIRQGVYEEKIFCDRKYTRFLGEDREKTILQWADGANHLDSKGQKLGTFRSYTAFFDGACLEVQNLTIKNLAGQHAGQGIAAAVHTACAFFQFVDLEGYQDTLFLGPLPLEERQKGGFRGPREHAPRRPSCQSYYDCRICGDIDYIFGGADALFTACEMQCREREIPVKGYLAAPSTTPDGIGFVFYKCRITGSPKQNTYLARPWRPTGKAAFFYCDIYKGITSGRFSPWGDLPDQAVFLEFGNKNSNQPPIESCTGTQAAQCLSQALQKEHSMIKQLRRRLQTMDIRYSANQKDFKRYTTEEIRDEFLIDNLYIPNEVIAVYSHVDRMVTLGCMPTTETVSIEKGMNVWETFGTDFFLERREIGIFNLGDAGEIEADGQKYTMNFEDCLYITKGTKQVLFRSMDAAKPARFFMVSAPAHKVCKTTFISMEEAQKRPCGQAETANKRVINQFIHPDVLETCQLSMGLTQLEAGSVWNTMPAHTHERRMEIYTYFNIPENHAVFHMMGEGQQTRHIVMQNYQAVISPSWSIHSGCGTSNYTFIWAMGGENLAFDDMDTIQTPDLR